MTNLTEKMKNRTLEDKRLYYCLFDNPKDYVAVYYGHYINDFHFDTYRRNNSVKIIREVPTLEELQRLESDILAKNKGVEIVAELKEENTSLKGLLKECKESLLEHQDICLEEGYTKEENIAINLIKKIEEVLDDRTRLHTADMR